MIPLKKLNGSQFMLNCDLIKTIESTPDTLITLSSGEKIMVLDAVDEVVRLTTDYRKRLIQEPPFSQTAKEGKD